jgi:lysozyme
MSDKGRKLLTEWEGKRNKVYLDSRGLPTIGVGHLLKIEELSSGKVNIGGVQYEYINGLTDDQVDKLLEFDLAWAEGAVTRYVKVPLIQNQFDALVSFVFNVGERAFHRSTLLKVLNAGDYDFVPAQLSRWTHSAGRVLSGLVNRRNSEIKLWSAA